MLRKNDTLTNSIIYNNINLEKNKLNQYDFPPMINYISDLQLPSEIEHYDNITI